MDPKEALMHRLFATSTLALAISAAACSSPSTSLDSSAQAESSLPAAVKIVDTTAGKVLANANGFSLYTFDMDTSTESTCYDSCATAWPALIVTDEQTLSAPFATTTRHDGAKQLTSQGHPLYRFAFDAQPGDIKGDGLHHVWHLARPVTDSTADAGHS
jgi:predicted lipoprotein with Yx(FWY)xxD motif